MKKGIYRKEYKEKGKIVFRYYYYKNNREVSEKDYKRIKKLGIIPSYRDVWISENEKDKLQAYGYDNNGKKQYRYNEEFVKEMTKKKFERIVLLIEKLPKLKRVIKKDRELDIKEKDKVISLMIELLLEYHMRIGKEEYAKNNKSYGLASLKRRHVKKEGKVIRIKYMGKSKQEIEYIVEKKRYVEDIKRLLKREGKESDNIFRYGDGKKITYKDVNEYIKRKIGEFSAKDIRTYAANYRFVSALKRMREPENEKEIRENIKRAYEITAERLRHTKNISKKSYVMDIIEEMYRENPIYFKEGNDANEIMKYAMNL